MLMTFPSITEDKNTKIKVFHSKIAVWERPTDPEMNLYPHKNTMSITGRRRRRNSVCFA